MRKGPAYCPALGFITTACYLRIERTSRIRSTPPQSQKPSQYTNRDDLAIPTTDLSTRNETFGVTRKHADCHTQGGDRAVGRADSEEPDSRSVDSLSPITSE